MTIQGSVSPGMPSGGGVAYKGCSRCPLKLCVNAALTSQGPPTTRQGLPPSGREVKRKLFLEQTKICVVPYHWITSGPYWQEPLVHQHNCFCAQKQKKIPKVLKKMQFPCFDALSYVHLTEGRLDIVFQCINKIWDIHPIIPIVKAAGGIITTWNNKDAVHAGNIIVSGNSSNHKKMIKLLKPVSK